VGEFVIGGGLPEQRTPWAIRPHIKLAQYSHQCGPLKVCTYTKDKDVIMSHTNTQFKLMHTLPVSNIKIKAQHIYTLDL